jgi:ATP-dependent RNA helicase DeaD
VTEIREKILEKSMVKFTDYISTFHDEEVLHFDSFKEKFESLEKEDVIKGLYGFMFENTLKRYQKAQEIDVAPKGKDRPQGVRVNTGMQRFFINLGTMDGATPGDLIKFVSTVAGISGRDIGRIDTKEKFAFIEAPAHLTDSILGLKGEMFGNRKVSVELSTTPPPTSGGRRGGSRFGGGGFRGGRGPREGQAASRSFR